MAASGDVVNSIEPAAFGSILSDLASQDRDGTGIPDVPTGSSTIFLTSTIGSIAVVTESFIVPALTGPVTSGFLPPEETGTSTTIDSVILTESTVASIASDISESTLPITSFTITTSTTGNAAGSSTVTPLPTTVVSSNGSLSSPSSSETATKVTTTSSLSNPRHHQSKSLIAPIVAPVLAFMLITVVALLGFIWLKRRKQYTKEVEDFERDVVWVTSPKNGLAQNSEVVRSPPATAHPEAVAPGAQSVNHETGMTATPNTGNVTSSGRERLKSSDSNAENHLPEDPFTSPASSVDEDIIRPSQIGLAMTTSMTPSPSVCSTHTVVRYSKYNPSKADSTAEHRVSSESNPFNTPRD